MEAEPDPGLRTPDSELEDSASPSPQPLTPSMPLLIEIGCEEIPARFLSEAQKRFGERLQAALEEAHLLARQPGIGSVGAVPDRSGQVAEPPLQTYSTPRRLVVYIPEVLANQPDQEEEILGPPLKLAFDAAGKPTRAAESFAAKNRAGLEDLVRVTTPKGEYVALKKTTPGRTAHEVLPEILPAVIAGLSFPKSMYWVAKSGPRFVRPIRWLLALLGEGKQACIIPFEVAGVRSGNLTCGHRTLGPGPVSVSGFSDYSRKLRQMGVEFDPEERWEQVQNEIKVLLEGSGLKVIEDRELEDWVVNSTEWPRALLGSFEERFLKLPREILVTVMRDHQKYFAVEDKQGGLQPRFVAVLNRDGDERGYMRAGHERVLTARFSDAVFFWKADQKIPLRERRPMLEKVTYQAELGSYADKVRRMEKLLGKLFEDSQLCAEVTNSDIDAVLRALEMCKCDLTTQMVQEFPELQGVVGGLYAREQGEAPEVWKAMYDHYLPEGFEDKCPRTVAGALLSLVDKFDSVVAGFVAGYGPTGSSDPFSMRRNGNALIKVLIEFALPVNLRDLSVYAYNYLVQSGDQPRSEVFEALLVFFGDRLRFYLETARGIRYDTVRAVMMAGSDIPMVPGRDIPVPVDALRRAEALQSIRDTDDFQSLSQAAKRIRNILTKSAASDDWSPGHVDTDILKEAEERELWSAFEEQGGEAMVLAKAGLYEKALRAIAKLRPAVDRFFDKVLVMAEDAAVRQNRLRVLGKLNQLFCYVADLSQIAPDGPNVAAATRRQ